jgi:small-conductance mechanosensitive channel
MSIYTVKNAIRVMVVVVGIFLVVLGCSDLASIFLSTELIASALGLLTWGLIEIIVGGIFVLAVVHPYAIKDFIRALTGR